MAIERVAVIGAGEWGTALAQAAALAGRAVTLIGRDPDVLAEINVAHTNRKHLGLLKLSTRISASSRYSGADLVILAVPAQATRAALAILGDPGEPVVLSA
jgi:glycerol-3-phosphate dehydrogenase (NAD(P)+)